MIKLNIAMPEPLWLKARRVAEQRRTNGRASVSGVLVLALKEFLARLEKQE
jgi:hypothetical protein